MNMSMNSFISRLALLIGNVEIHTISVILSILLRNVSVEPKNVDC